MSGMERWKFRASVMCSQRERWHWQYGVGMNQARGWLVGGFLLLSHQKETQTTRQNNNNQTHRTEIRSYAEGGCALRLLLRWHLVGLSRVPSLLLRKKRGCGGGFLQKSRLFPNIFVMWRLLALRVYFCFSLNVLKGASFFMKILSTKKNPSL